MKAKHLGRALEQIAEEGGAQVFKMFLGSDFIVGVVGALQFDVLADRIASEFDLPCHFEATTFEVVRWVDADDPKLIKKFADANRDNIAEDHSGATVFLARNEWQMNRAKQDFPKLRFLADARAGAAHGGLGLDDPAGGRELAGVAILEPHRALKQLAIDRPLLGRGEERGAQRGVADVAARQLELAPSSRKSMSLATRRSRRDHAAPQLARALLVGEREEHAEGEPALERRIDRALEVRRQDRRCPRTCSRRWSR